MGYSVPEIRRLLQLAGSESKQLALHRNVLVPITILVRSVGDRLLLVPTLET